ncbi:60S ribosomal protein L22-like [Panicum virgatum]|uniref:60S ribosomal protein L22-like n=1 Tax=Panicum virgatum TaxID=38727 RepID=UPI0019D5E4B1|nr:60S ribosomal protein L22-like [Panicum virgatum]
MQAAHAQAIHSMLVTLFQQLPQHASHPSQAQHHHAQHTTSTRNASRAKAGIPSRASRAMQHATLCRPRSAKPLPPSCHIVPSPRRAARRAKAVPAAATAAVRHNASASRPTSSTRPGMLTALLAPARPGSSPAHHHLSTTAPQATLASCCPATAPPLKAAGGALAQLAAVPSSLSHPAPRLTFSLAPTPSCSVLQQEESHRRSPPSSQPSSIPPTPTE